MKTHAYCEHCGEEDRRQGMTDRHGNTWTVTPQGPTTYLLTRPGAMKWVSASDLKHGISEREPTWHDGLELRSYNGRRVWERVAG